MNLQALIRPSILELTAYSSARSLNKEGKIFLDANESAVAPKIGTENTLESKLNRYPSPQPTALLKNFSRIYQVPPEKILMGRGSDEAIDLLTRALCEPSQDSILTTPPTYGMYKVSADIQNVKTLKVPLLQKNKTWSLDLAGIKAQLSSPTPAKLIYICSPNNPTGTAFPLDDIRKICQWADQSLVVLDEAYGEFAESFSGIPLLKEFKNLAILRTLSKAWGLAGLRCGVLMADPELIAVLQKVRAPYPLPQPVIELAVSATDLEGEKQMRTLVLALAKEKEQLQKNLEEHQDVIRVYPSQSNFLLVEFRSAQKAMDLARQEGIILRDRNNEIPQCVRITVGTPQENALLLLALQKELL
jgi:histidinol-phosphate aminotransferase